LLLDPLAPLLKEGVPALGPPRDGFGSFLALLDGGEECAGECFDGQDICTNELHEFAKLDSFLRLDLLGPIHEGLEFGVKVAWFAGHGTSSMIVRGRASSSLAAVLRRCQVIWTTNILV